MSNDTQNWRPSCDIETLHLRAEIINKVRHFFEQRNVLEVETPLLSSGTVTDVHLEAFSTQFEHSQNADTSQQTLYLQTSPEFAMKRLLAAGSGPIFQICKAFRNEAEGRFHNPEFTMLEWYRPGFSDHDLMEEVDQLMQFVLGCEPAIKMSYQAVFIEFLDLDPLSATIEQIRTLALQKSDDSWIEQEQDKDTLLQWLFSLFIEPQLGMIKNGQDDTSWRPVFVYNFPASQAALAKINCTDKRVAHRFELYYQGIELANGYDELQDPEEQKQRFLGDNTQRQMLSRNSKPLDYRFLEAMNAGLPESAGVALGLDRLIMCALHKTKIQDVLTFSTSRA